MKRVIFGSILAAFVSVPIFADICGVGFLDTAYIDGPHPLSIDPAFVSTAAMYNSKHDLADDFERIPQFFSATSPPPGYPEPTYYFDASKTFFEFTLDYDPEGGVAEFIVECGDYLSGTGPQFTGSAWRERPDGASRYQALANLPEFSGFDAVFVHLEVNSSCIGVAQVNAVAQTIKSITPGVDVVVGVGIPGATYRSYSPHPVDFNWPENGQWFDGTYVDAMGFFNHGQVDPEHYDPPGSYGGSGGKDWTHKILHGSNEFKANYDVMVNRSAASGTDAFFVGTITAEVIDQEPQFDITEVRDAARWVNWRSWFVAQAKVRDLLVFPYPEQAFTPHVGYVGGTNEVNLRTEHAYYFDLGLDPNACLHH